MNLIEILRSILNCITFYKTKYEKMQAEQQAAEDLAAQIKDLLDKWEI